MSARHGGAHGPRRTAIDWTQVRARVDAARVVVEAAWTPPAEETRRILHQRALVLAAELAATHPLDAGIDVLEFRLAHERFGIECSWVREVYPLETLTPVPCTPEFVLGIVNLRGEIVSVIDVRRFFELPEGGLSDLNKVIVLASGDMVFGIVADAILGVRRILLSELQPSLPTLTGIRDKYLKGIAPERMVILDAERLLSDEGIVVDEHVSG